MAIWCIKSIFLWLVVSTTTGTIMLSLEWCCKTSSQIIGAGIKLNRFGTIKLVQPRHFLLKCLYQARSCVCVLEVSILHLSTTLIYDFGIVPTVWYFSPILLMLFQQIYIQYILETIVNCGFSVLQSLIYLFVFLGWYPLKLLA